MKLRPIYAMLTALLYCSISNALTYGQLRKITYTGLTCSNITFDILRTHPKTTAVGLGCGAPLLYHKKINKTVAIKLLSYTAGLFLATTIINEIYDYDEQYRKEHQETLQELASIKKANQKNFDSVQKQLEQNQQSLMKLEATSNEHSKHFLEQKKLLDQIKDLQDELFKKNLEIQNVLEGIQKTLKNIEQTTDGHSKNLIEYKELLAQHNNLLQNIHQEVATLKEQLRIVVTKQDLEEQTLTILSAIKQQKKE